jgi:hypothetical protein
MNEFLHPSQHLEPPDTGNPPALGGTPPNEPGPEKKKKRSRLRQLFLVIAYGLLVFIVLLVGAGAALTFFFPSERLRPIAEKELSSFLKMPVSIESLDISILSGVKISRLALGENAPFFAVDDLVLDYDLTQLLQGRFVINQVLALNPKLNLISVDGVWNFQPLLELGGSEKPPPVVEEKPDTTGQPPGLPPIPIAVDLREFAIRNVQVNLDMDGKMKSRVEGLTLEANGIVQQDKIDIVFRTLMAAPAQGEHNLEFYSNEGKGIDVKTLSLVNMEVSAQDLNNIRLTGNLSLQNNRFHVPDALPVPDLSVALDFLAEVQEQGLTIRQLLVKLDENNRVDITGSASGLAKDPRFDITLNEASFKVEEVIKWAGTMIPKVEASGNLLVSDVNVKGHLPGFKPEDIELKNATVRVNNFSARYPELSASLKNLNVGIDIADVKLKDSVPENLNMNVRVAMEQAKAPDIAINGFNHELSIHAKGANLADASLVFSTALKSARYSTPELGSIQTGLDANGSLSANIESGDIHFFKADYALGSAVIGEVKANAKNFGKAAFKVEQDVAIELTKLRALIPTKLLKKIDGYPTAGKTTVRAVVQGKLDEKFMPVQALVNTQVELKGIDTELKNPKAKVKQFSTTVSFPLDYIPSKGVKIPVLDLVTRFESIKALDKIEVGAGEITTHLTMGAFYPLQDSARATIPITNKTTVKLDRITTNAPEIRVTGLAVDTAIKTSVKGQGFKNLSLDGRVTVQDIDGVKEVKTGKIKTAFSVGVNDLSLTQTTVRVDLNVDPPLPEKLNGEIPIGPITLTSRSKQNLKTGDVEIEQVKVVAPSLVNLDLKASLKNWGKTFQVNTEVSDTQLAALWEKVPKALRAGMEDLEVAGAINLSLTADGTIPEEIDLKKPLPIQAKAGFGLGGASVNWPSKGIAIDNMSTTAQVDVTEGSGEVSGKFAIAKLFLKNELGEEWLNPQFDFRYALNDLNKFTVREHTFSIKKFGVSHTFSGQVDGLKPFLTGIIPMTPEELTRRLDVSLATRNQLDIHKAINEGTRKFLKGIQAKGALISELSLKLAPKEKIEVEGQVAFDQFNAQVQDKIQVTDLSGRIPFKKTLFLDRALVRPMNKSFLASRRGFFTQLRGFSQNRNNLTIKEVQAAGQKVSNIAFDLLYKNNRLMAEKFLFDVLDGSVAGNLFVIPTPKGPELSFSTEFAGLNFGALTGRSRSKEKAESDIDGNLRLGVKLRQEQSTEPITLDQITANIAITRIGAETLDRALLFLDPEESKPAIVDIRAKLKLASPHRLVVEVENGNLSVAAWLKNKVLGDIIQAPELKRVPITSIKEFRNLTEQLKALTGLRDALNYLAARGMEFTEDGEIQLY